MGIDKAVATSTPTPLARHKLDRAGVLESFKVVVGGDQVLKGKPAPDLFLLTAERLGRDPRRCAVLEDSAPGIRAAAAAGMAAILIPDLCRIDSETQQLVSATARALLAAIPILQRLAA